MHGGDSTPIIDDNATVSDVLESLSASGLGIVCVCSNDQHLEGIVTDGDIRRLMAEGAVDTQTAARSVMTSESYNRSVDDVTLHEALAIDGEQASDSSMCFRLLLEGRVVGVLRLHDVVRANM